MGNIGSSWDASRDLTLKTLQAQLEAQLTQRRVGIEAEQSFGRFTNKTINDLAQEQGAKRLEAVNNYRTLLQSNYINKRNEAVAATSQHANDIIQGMNADPARQAAVATIAEAAGGQGIARVPELGNEAMTARGTTQPVDLTGVQAGLAQTAQEAAAPVAIKMQLEDTLRPFKLQNMDAINRNTIAQTSSQNLGAQVQSLAQLTRYNTAPLNTLGNLYGSTAGAFKEAPVSRDVVAARYGDYGYQNPNDMYRLY